MASAPSASARAAVIRYRGNLFGRTPASKPRPPSGSYSRGLEYGAARGTDPPRRGSGLCWQWGGAFREWGQGVFRDLSMELRGGSLAGCKWQVTRGKKQQPRGKKALCSGQPPHPRTAVGLAAEPRVSRAEAEQCRCLRVWGSFRSVWCLVAGVNKGLGSVCGRTGGHEQLESRSKTVCLPAPTVWAPRPVLRISFLTSPSEDRARDPLLWGRPEWTALRRGGLLCTEVVSEMLRRKLGLWCRRLWAGPGEVAAGVGSAAAAAASQPGDAEESAVPAGRGSEQKWDKSSALSIAARDDGQPATPVEEVGSVSGQRQNWPSALGQWEAGLATSTEAGENREQSQTLQPRAETLKSGRRAMTVGRLD
ncbi:uncharacterized protein LOC136771551 [Amia ocellicauda]|uniref:uncharacterized protein LOC136771551 n=1 Tax=Amia ocellicauda TaxID=2972642 RepID=UPI0034638726